VELSDLGRFSDVAVQVLVALAAGPKHGWAITEDIELRVGRRPQPATLYGTLSRLEERGWIAGLPVEGRRRPFSITTSGRDALAAYLEHLSATVTAGRRALKVRPV